MVITLRTDAGQAEIDRIRNHARLLSYVRRVVSYVRIKDSKSDATG